MILKKDEIAKERKELITKGARYVSCQKAAKQITHTNRKAINRVKIRNAAGSFSGITES